MKKLLALLVAASSLLALDGTGSYKIEMSDNQKVINVYAKNVGYMNVSLTPSSCGMLSVYDKHNKIIPNTFSWGANIKVSVGTYRIQVIPNRGDCILNVLMPERINNYSDTEDEEDSSGGISIKRSQN